FRSNLDFADLDFTIIENASGSTFKSVIFSSFRNSALIGNSYFWKFQSTQLSMAHEGGFKLMNGIFQDFHFRRMIVDIDAIDATIVNCSFIDCDVRAKFREKTRIKNCKVAFTTTNKIADRAAQTLKLFRDQHNEQRDMEEAAHFHYEYNKQVGKTYFSALYYHRDLLSGHGHHLALSDLLDMYYLRRTTREQFGKILTAYLVSRINWLVSFKATVRVLELYMRAVGNLLSRCIWGYGTKPARTLFFGFTVILAYASFYYFDPASITAGDASYSLAFSMASFATMTLEKYQNARHLIFVVSAEALTGILTLGMFISSSFAKIRES
ncbi:MAG: hypothetical protein OJJ21_03755, partial [Ferrovibrio sp.]|uniref:hypothetical protein n=1 Tax=Ferrovibrio sp. TaxID=1917215 RepID=UPI00262B6FF9